MANRGVGYGLSAQVANKLASKRDPELEAEALGWIEAILGEKLPQGNYDDVLKDGVVLCKFMNKLSPGSINKINTTGAQFKMMENINKFQEACKKFGVPDIDVFQTVDLWEKRNLSVVTQCIMAIARACYSHPEFTGPFLGPKPSEENKREFSEEQLRAGDAVISLQYGTNKGASQSGQNFGQTRHM